MGMKSWISLVAAGIFLLTLQSGGAAAQDSGIPPMLEGPRPLSNPDTKAAPRPPAAAPATPAATAKEKQGKQKAKGKKTGKKTTVQTTKKADNNAQKKAKPVRSASKTPGNGN
jgi:hypothetical protein